MQLSCTEVLLLLKSRSHYNCRYFVLPCCPWDFGNKFNCNGKGRNTSQYQSYLEFVEEVGQVCGFTVERDTLRIPSTKRVSTRNADVLKLNFNKWFKDNLVL